MSLVIQKPTGANIRLNRDHVAAGPLDIGGTAAAAYSLRNLSANYTGSVVRVRRSSDNTEQDFTATQVTDGTLTTFCGAGDGFVRTWYDQSGNGRHATQTTTTNQPQIVSSGSLLVDNTKPCIAFNAARNDHLRFGEITLNSWSCFSVTRRTSADAAQNIIAIARADNGNCSLECGVNNLASYGPIILVANAAGQTFPKGGLLRQGEQRLISGFYNGGPNGNIASYALTDNNSAVSLSASSFVSSANSTFSVIGAVVTSAGLSNWWGGNMQEIVVYDSNLVSINSNINQNINAHYAIY